MRIQEFCFNRVEEFFAECGAQTDIALTQLSSGRLDFHSTQVEIDGVRIEWNRVGARIRSREVNRGPGLMFGWALQSPSEVKCFGHGMRANDAVVWPLDDELEYVGPTGVTSLIILVDQKLIDLLGWRVHRLLWRQVPMRHLNALQRVCRAATEVARHGPWREASEPGAGAIEPSGAVWRDRILAALEPVLAPWLREPGASDTRVTRMGRDYQIVRAVDQLFSDQGPERKLTAEALAEILGVPRRTLFHAFRQSLGVGPLAYLKIVRLHQLRASLLAASAERSSIMRLAMDLGFTHLGRLSADYRKHFGEYPSDTLRRP